MLTTARRSTRDSRGGSCARTAASSAKTVDEAG